MFDLIFGLILEQKLSLLQHFQTNICKKYVLRCLLRQVTRRKATNILVGSKSHLYSYYQKKSRLFIYLPQI